MITYNHELFIRKAIESVLIQRTNFTFNLVIGEDCSTDNTLNLIKKYIKRNHYKIQLITSEQNMGILPNLIRTLNACTGKYIALCEGDDYWTDPYKLQKQVDFLEANLEYGMVSSDIILIDKNGDRLPDNNMVLKQREKRKPDVDFFDLLETNLANTLTVCVRTDLMKELANRVVEENLQFVYDYFFWLNIAMKSKICIMYEKMAAYRVHEKGISTNHNFFNNKSLLIKKYAINNFIELNHNISFSRKLRLLKSCADMYFKKILDKNEDIILINFIHKHLFIIFYLKIKSIIIHYLTRTKKLIIK